MDIFGFVPEPIQSQDVTHLKIYFIVGFHLYIACYIVQMKNFFTLQETPRSAAPRGLGIEELSLVEFYYSCSYVLFGLCWFATWYFVFGNLDVRITFFNLLYSFIVIATTRFYYFGQIRIKTMRRTCFTSLMVLFTLYCLLSGGSSSPFFVIFASITIFFGHELWNLKVSLVLFFAIYAVTTYLPRMVDSIPILPEDLLYVYLLNFIAVASIIGIIYQHYPQGQEDALFFTRILEFLGKSKAPVPYTPSMKSLKLKKLMSPANKPRVHVSTSNDSSCSSSYSSSCSFSGSQPVTTLRFAKPASFVSDEHLKFIQVGDEILTIHTQSQLGCGSFGAVYEGEYVNQTVISFTIYEIYLSFSRLFLVSFIAFILFLDSYTYIFFYSYFLGCS